MLSADQNRSISFSGRDLAVVPVENVHDLVAVDLKQIIALPIHVVGGYAVRGRDKHEAADALDLPGEGRAYERPDLAETLVKEGRISRVLCAPRSRIQAPAFSMRSSS